MPIYKSNTPTKDGRSYYFKTNYKDVFGTTKTYKSKKYKTRKEADIGEAEFKISTGSLCNNQSITIKEAFIDYLNIHQRELKPQTIDRTKCMFKYIEPIGNIKINDFNVSHYKTWSNYLQKFKYTPNYMNKIQGLLKRIISHSYKYYNTSTTTLKFFEVYKSSEIEKEMDFYTLDEFKQFITGATDYPEYKRFFECLYMLGLRKGELQAITFDDIDFNKETIRINKTLTTKLKGELYTITKPKTNSSIRTLPLPKPILKAFKEQKDYYEQFTDYNVKWFVFGGILPFRETTIEYKNKLFSTNANIRKIRIHDFRHSCASYLINNGATIVLVSKYLGHSNINITLKTYTHLYKNELDNVSNMFNNI